ncbi:hypothetical protein [Thalassolituus oleivorans]|uniref:hypothetical protein n=1 Tax=Thalassolituus oleivorans TaxID=187493 RepID=UPI0023F18533|nr:hypothetical protein [Thalassolituus oleivorans]
MTRYEYIENELNIILKKYQRDNFKDWFFVAGIDSLEDFLSEIGIIERVVSNDVEKLLSGLWVGARLGYLIRLIGGTVIPTFLTDIKSRGHAAISGGLPPYLVRHL